jgi:hypothetical protein
VIWCTVSAGISIKVDVRLKNVTACSYTKSTYTNQLPTFTYLSPYLILGRRIVRELSNYLVGKYLFELLCII